MEKKIKKLWSSVVIRSFVLIILAFIVLCLVLIWLVSTDDYSPITNDQWITIFVTFFAGTLGGLIAVGGISWQLKQERNEENRKKEEEKVEKKKKVEEYINYILKEVKNNNLLEKLLQSEQLIIYNTPLFEYRSVTKRQIIEFESNYMNSNIETILTLQNGVQVLKIATNIKEYNIELEKQMEMNELKDLISRDSTTLLEEIKKIKDEIEHKNLSISNEIKIKSKMFFLIYYLTQITMFITNISVSKIVDKSLLKEVNSNKNPMTVSLKSQSGELFEIINNLDNGEVKKEEALKISTKLNKLLLRLVASELYNLKRINEEHKFKDIKKLYNNLLLSIHGDLRINGYALNLYEEICQMKDF